MLPTNTTVISLFALLNISKNTWKNLSSKRLRVGGRRNRWFVSRVTVKNFGAQLDLYFPIFLFPTTFRILTHLWQTIYKGYHCSSFPSFSFLEEVIKKENNIIQTWHLIFIGTFNMTKIKMLEMSWLVHGWWFWSWLLRMSLENRQVVVDHKQQLWLLWLDHEMIMSHTASQLWLEQCFPS